MNKNSVQQNNIMGRLLARLRSEREALKLQAIDDLWRRNGLANPKSRAGYKLAETPTVTRDGREITEYRLYKLVDETITELSADIRSITKNGSQTTEQDNKMA